MPSENPTSITPLAGRLRYIDGLRGVAALLVVVFHIHFQSTSPISAAQQKMIPGFIWDILMHFNLGVDIFFVLSGFVIARSLRRDYVTPELFVRFAARRSLRLDIPYWSVILVVVGSKWLLSITNPHQQWSASGVPSVVDLLANFAYLQNALNPPRINVLVVAWTLCLELAFYISFVSLLAMAQQLSRERAGRPKLVALLIVFAPTLLISLWSFYFESFGLRHDDIHSGIHLFLSYWHLFLLGGILQWTVEGWIRPNWFYGVLVLLMLLTVLQAAEVHSMRIDGLVGGATALSIFLAAHWNRMDRWLGNSFIQLAGKTSYTIYLIHVPICMLVLGAVKSHWGMTTASVWIGPPLVLVATALVTAMVYYLIESPSLRLSHKITVHAKKTEQEFPVDPISTAVPSA